MKQTSANSKPSGSKDSAASTCSPASAAGDSPSSLPDGHESGLFGPVPVRVNRSAQREKERAKKMSATFGRACFASSASVALQRCLASKLAETMDTDGSPEYKLTWKRRAMPSGLRICRLVASARRTSGSGCSGWPTPVAQPANGTPERFLERKRESVARGSSMGIVLSDLAMVAQLAGWPTPMAGNPGTEEYNAAGNTDSSRKTVELVGWPTATSEDGERGANRANKNKSQLNDTAMLVGWATPTTRDHKDGDCSEADVPVNGLLGRQVVRYSAPTENRGVLNPAFSLWLMGYPSAWFALGMRAMRSLKRR